jgi:phage gpG-like protein
VTRIVWNEAALAEMLEGRQGEVALDLERRATNVESQAKLNASGQPGPNVRTGRLRASITHELAHDERGLVARVGSNVEYARYVEEGTEPHRIVPRRAQALHWPGAAHPVLAVNHPGTRARPYLRPALSAASL